MRLHRNPAGQRISKILDAAAAAAEEHRRRISTATINMVVRDAVNWRQPPTLRGANRKGRIYYATQVCSTLCPPSQDTISHLQGGYLCSRPRFMASNARAATTVPHRRAYLLSVPRRQADPHASVALPVTPDLTTIDCRSCGISVAPLLLSICRA